MSRKIFDNHRMEFIPWPVNKPTSSFCTKNPLKIASTSFVSEFRNLLTHYVPLSLCGDGNILEALVMFPEGGESVILCFWFFPILRFYGKMVIFKLFCPCVRHTGFYINHCPCVGTDKKMGFWVSDQKRF